MDKTEPQEIVNTAAREIWSRFVGIPITEPYDKEFEWLCARLRQVEIETDKESARNTSHSAS